MDGGRTGFLKNCYMGDKAAGHTAQILRAVERGTYIPKLYLITFARNEREQLDIVHAKYLLRPAVRNTLPPICGVAIGRKEAFEVVRRMVSDCYQATGSVALQSFLLSDRS